MIDEEVLERELMTNVTDEWRKIAFVVGTTLMKVAEKHGVKLDDSFFHMKIVSLVERGVIEHNGDLSQMRACEIRCIRDEGRFGPEKD